MSTPPRKAARTAESPRRPADAPAALRRVSAVATGPATLQQTPSPSLREQWREVVLLTILYTLQGVPLGVIHSMQLLLQGTERVSLTQMGTFSLSSYPYSLKLLWSPVVDAVYSRRIGQRKSWIIPSQLLAACMLLFLSHWAEEWIEQGRVAVLTATCFALVLVVATQDIAVDGWAVTLLSEKHRGFGSTCQTVGLYLGHSISFNFFLSMNSVEFCNAYLRSEPQAEPFWTLGGFLYFWAVAFVAVTLFVARGVPERSSTASGARHGTAQRVRDAYVEIMRVMRLPSVLSLCLVLITSRLAFAVTDNISLLRMQHKGLAPETIGVLATLQLPFDIFFSALAGAFGARSRLGLFTPWLRVYVPRLALSLAAAALVWLMPERAPGHATAQPFGWGFLALTFSVQVLYSFCSTVMFVTQSAFFSSVSDERIGGSYMTLLNTVANLANQIGKLFIFALVDAFSCVEDACPLGCDPYYAFSLVFAALGVAWFVVMRGRVAALQRLPKSAWRVPLRSSAAAYSSK